MYTANAGKLDDLHARFRDHTLKFFEKHGIANIGYWTPIENPDEKLYYLIAHKDAAARDASFKAPGADPGWQEAVKASHKNGVLAKKMESILLDATDYSPEIKAATGAGERVFELRTYTTENADKLAHLNARFRDHTVALFAKHGMTNLWYTTVDDKQKDDAAIAGRQLVYMLTHTSTDDAKKSFAAFRDDPAWVAARKASEEKAGGSLTIKDGVKSLMLKATDYSPTK
ncbi:MAG: NIPSNAP family protein [Pirellulales bacterium]